MTDARLVHLADEDEAIRRSAGMILRSSGLGVRTYLSGAELIESAAFLDPGCILLDVRMAARDGYQVQQELKSRGITLPVIIMTGHGDVPLAVEAMEAGAVDFIEKPFDRALLLAAIDQAFDRLGRASEAVARPS